MLRSPHNLTVIMGTDAELPCEAYYDPIYPFINYTWYHQAQSQDQKQMITRGADRNMIIHEGILRIIRINRNDSGIYTCDVSSPGGNYSRTATLKVIGK